MVAGLGGDRTELAYPSARSTLLARDSLDPDYDSLTSDRAVFWLSLTDVVSIGKNSY